VVKVPCHLRHPGTDRIGLAPEETHLSLGQAHGKEQAVRERALKKAILHRKNALFYKTQNGAHVGDLFMSLICTCQLNQVNPFDYLTKLQQHGEQLAANPEHWMPGITRPPWHDHFFHACRKSTGELRREQNHQEPQRRALFALLGKVLASDCSRRRVGRRVGVAKKRHRHGCRYNSRRHPGTATRAAGSLACLSPHA
jgi:hypothetical protein